MKGSELAAVAPEIAKQVLRLRQSGSARDMAMARIDQVRSGQIQDLLPDAFSDEIPRSVAANFIDTAARDIAELIAPLPSPEFNDESFTSAAKKAFASKKTNIALGYWHESHFELQMATGADRAVTYGFLPFLAEPDYNLNAPVIHVMDPRGCYYLKNRNGDVVVFVQVVKERAEVLANLFSEYRNQILNDKDAMGFAKPNPDAELEVVRYFSPEQTVCFLPGRNNLQIAAVPQLLGRVPIHVAERPGNDGPRGQFDDAIDVQLARAAMARMGLDAAYKSVNAPLALPIDVQDFSVGPDVVLRTQSPDKIRRVGMELPPGAFQMEQVLEKELRLGTRYPESRSGDMDGSIITGRGVQALQGAMDTQVKTWLLILRPAIAGVTSDCFEIDFKVFPKRTRTIHAVNAGVSIAETYTPDKDIRGDFRIDVQYGMAAGLGVNQAAILILQLLGGGLMSRAAALRQLPMGGIDPVKMERDVQVQQVRDGLMQGVAGLAQSAAVLFEQGGDPSQVLQKVATMVTAMGKGVAVEDAYLTAFPPPPPQPEEMAPGEPGAPPGPGGEGAPPGFSDTTGLPMGTAQAGQAPGGHTGMLQLLAGLSPSGRANLSANTTRRVPAIG